MLLKNSSILVRTGVLKARKTLWGCQIMSNPLWVSFSHNNLKTFLKSLYCDGIALPLLWFDRSCLLLSLCAGNDSVADCRQISSQGNMCSACAMCYVLCSLLVLCAMCSAALLNSSRVAAGCPIAQLSDSPPDGGSARSLSGLLPRPGNSGKLSRHETTLGEGGGYCHKIPK